MHKTLLAGAVALMLWTRPGAAQISRWNSGALGDNVVALGRDARGEIWAGTEDHGVAHFSGGKWSGFSVQDGLGDDNAYAIAGDRLGRVWVGHLNHGVSVWNGTGWKNYGITEGPLGERVFAIATSPLDGDVWIAHNAGLTRYSLADDSWTHFNRANGFPTDEISALAFDARGQLYVGTQHQGILAGAPADNFASWRAIIRGAQTMPTTPEGEGLPSNCINALLVAHDGTIYAATDTGLAQSRDGQSWTFVRGADWRAKVVAKGLAPAPEDGRELLQQDYLTALCEDERGLLWVGYRREGYEALRPATEGVSILWPLERPASYPTSMLPLGDGSVLLGYYVGGVKVGDRVPPFSLLPAEAQIQGQLNAQTVAAPAAGAALPSAAGAPEADELKRLLSLVRARSQTPEATRVVQLPDDWTTQGTWWGRYGRYWAALGAMSSPSDYLWGAGREPVNYNVRIGPDADAGDSLRYWIQWLHTADPRSVEMPSIYLDSRITKNYITREDDPAKQQYRRQSEWSDHGEAYPMTKRGPGLFLTVRVPPGNYVLSLFDRNKDGHDAPNWARDYLVSVRPHPQGTDLFDISEFDDQPEWASSRWHDFWGSSWKRFAVRGPQELTIRLDRHNSLNTILAGAFLDEINEEPEAYFDARPAESGAAWHAAPGAARPEDELAETIVGRIAARPKRRSVVVERQRTFVLPGAVAVLPARDGAHRARTNWGAVASHRDVRLCFVPLPGVGGGPGKARPEKSAA